MEIENQKIANLSGFEDNPRTITASGVRKLKASITRFGLFKPLLVWENDAGRLVVIGGNQRLRVMREMVSDQQLPDDVIPCVRFDGSEAEARTVALRDNNADGDWAWEDLGKYIADLDKLSADADLNIGLTGFDDTVIQDLRDLAGAVDSDLTRFSTAENEEDEDDLFDDGDDAEEADAEDPNTRRQIARFTVGSIRGVIGVEHYRRFLRCWQQHSDITKSTDIQTILASILTALDVEEGGEAPADELASNGATE